MNDALFPELESSGNIIIPASCQWIGELRSQYGHPLTSVHLLAQWDDATGWTVGWCIFVGRGPHHAVVDEWTPAAPDAWKVRSTWPWHRLDSMPCSGRFAIAAAQAARGCKIVLEQAKGYVHPDVAAEISQVQDAMEAQARAWLLGAAHS